MSSRVQTQAKAPTAPTPSFTPARAGMLHREATSLTAGWGEDRRKRLVSQRPFIQAKLTIGRPNDRFEQEADRVAEQVMRMPEPRLQRQIQPEEEEEKTLQTKPLASQITPLVQRQVEPEEEEKEEPIQTKQAGGWASRVDPSQEAQIRALRDAGRPLSQSVRGFFEPRFGHDFSRVRVHTGSKSAQISRKLSANAFTVGRDIYFAAGQYDPKTSEGKRLLAHELTHIVQQANDGLGTPSRLRRAVNFKADFKDISVKPQTAAAFSGDLFTYEDAEFSAKADIVATGDSEAELDEWDVGILQDMTVNWEREYWRRPNRDRRGRFLEQKFKKVNKRFRDQSDDAKTVWSDDTEHQELSALPKVSSDTRFRASTTITTEDTPGYEDQLDGEKVPGGDASDSTRNISCQRVGTRFDTWISAHNTVTDKWRHFRRLNWNYQRSLDFRGRGPTLVIGSETCKVGKHGPYDGGKEAPLISGTTANDAVEKNGAILYWSIDRVDGWT